MTTLATPAVPAEPVAWLENDDIDEMADRYGDHDKTNDCYAFNRQGPHSVRALVAEVMRRAPASPAASPSVLRQAMEAPKEMLRVTTAADSKHEDKLPSVTEYKAGRQKASAALSALRSELAAAPLQPVACLSESHALLAKFYGVSTLGELVDAQAHHIEKLQAKLPPSPNVFTPQQVRKA